MCSLQQAVCTGDAAVIKGGGVVLQCGTLVRAGTAAFSGGPGLATLTER